MLYFSTSEWCSKIGERLKTPIYLYRTKFANNHSGARNQLVNIRYFASIIATNKPLYSMSSIETLQSETLILVCMRIYKYTLNFIPSLAYIYSFALCMPARLCARARFRVSSAMYHEVTCLGFPEIEFAYMST